MTSPLDTSTVPLILENPSRVRTFPILLVNLFHQNLYRVIEDKQILDIASGYNIRQFNSFRFSVEFARYALNRDNIVLLRSYDSTLAIPANMTYRQQRLVLNTTVSSSEKSKLTLFFSGIPNSTGSGIVLENLFSSSNHTVSKDYLEDKLAEQHQSTSEVHFAKILRKPLNSLGIKIMGTRKNGHPGYRYLLFEPTNSVSDSINPLTNQSVIVPEQTEA